MCSSAVPPPSWGQQIDSLHETATTVMLTRLPRRLTMRMLLQHLSVLVDRRGYNYVQLPPASPPAANNGLAFINFMNHRIAAYCFEALKQMEFYSGNRRLGTCRPLQAHVQGLGENLIWFVVTYGLDALDDNRAPFVFENGIRVVNLRSVLDRHVTWEMTHRAHLQAQELRNHGLQAKVSESAGSNEADAQDVSSSVPALGHPPYGVGVGEQLCFRVSTRDASSSSMDFGASETQFPISPWVNLSIAGELGLAQSSLSNLMHNAQSQVHFPARAESAVRTPRNQRDRATGSSDRILQQICEVIPHAILEL